MSVLARRVMPNLVARGASLMRSVGSAVCRASACSARSLSVLSIHPSVSSIRSTKLRPVTISKQLSTAAKTEDDGPEPEFTFLAKDEVTDRVLTVIKKFDRVDPNKVIATSHFNTDLGLDSLDVVEIVMNLEDEFKITISDEEADSMLSVPRCVEYITKQPSAK